MSKLPDSTTPNLPVSQPPTPPKRQSPNPSQRSESATPPYAAMRCTTGLHWLTPLEPPIVATRKA